MVSEKLGENILDVEVTNISKNGFWIFVDDRELFLPFDKFPWFKNSTIDEITDIKREGERHLFWEKLDIDLTVEMIQNPDRYPLVAKI
ncbi:MAG: DUF2442 domain-containing protein [Campylobacterales bacterium]